jgi:uroporphyrinogen decarboxylase
VRTREDWRRVRDEHLQPCPELRFPADWSALEARFAGREEPLGMPLCGAFGHPRNLMGDEHLLVTYYDDPALIHEIQEHWVWLYRQIIDEVTAHLQLDYVLLWEDMAYKTGPLISPALFREFMLPYYQEIVSHIRSKGIDLVFVDTDGNAEVLLPLFLEAGINGFFPFERAANMDPVRLRRQYGHAFCIFGGIDKREVARGREAIARHVDAFVPALLEDGGYIPMLDHSAPPDISLDSMKYLIERLRFWSEKVYGA